MKRSLPCQVFVLVAALLNVAPTYAEPLGVPGPNSCGDIADDRRFVASHLQEAYVYQKLGDDAAACAPTLHGDNAKCDMFTTAATLTLLVALCVRRMTLPALDPLKR